MASNNPVLERRFVRIPSIVPVNFQLLSSTGNPLDLEVRTAFTRDLCAGGLCLEIHSLPASLVTQLAEPRGDFGVVVDLEIPGRALRLWGRVAWQRQVSEGTKPMWLLGVQFRDLSPSDGEAIQAYAVRVARRPRIVKAVLATLAVLLVMAGGLYLWRVRGFESVLAETHENLDRARGHVTRSNDALGDMQLELRWLSVRAHELVQTLDASDVAEKTADAESTEERTVLKDLAASLDRLEVLIRRECKIKD